MDNNDQLDLSYSSLWKSIIRPPKDIYDIDMLGDNIFNFKGITYTRKDYDILNDRSEILKCSFVEPSEDTRPIDVMPVVLYLHGNSSSRIEGLKVLPELLKRNINLFVVDFAGCGLSEGEYISLGWHEKNDVITIIDFIERLPRVGKIGIWGRSMGAATTLMFNKIDSRASAACYDSSFSEFTKLAKELCKKHVKIPGVIISVVMSLVRNSIIERNYLDIYKLNPIESASCIKCPGFFIHAKNDELIPIDHSIDIYSNYQGKKTMNVCDGSHNTVRQKQLQEKVADFFKRYLHNNDNDSNIRGKTSSKNLPGINKIYNKDNKQKSKNKSLSSKDLNLGLSKLSF